MAGGVLYLGTHTLSGPGREGRAPAARTCAARSALEISKTRLAGETRQLRSVRAIPLGRVVLSFASHRALHSLSRPNNTSPLPTQCRSAAKHRQSSCCARVRSLVQNHNTSLELSKLPQTQTLILILILAGTDQSQGRGQVISNINACLAVQATIKGTLGTYGGDLLMVDANVRQTITNDGSTVMKVARPPNLFLSPRSQTACG